MVLFCLWIFVSHLWLLSLRKALGRLCECSHATATLWRTTVIDFEMVAKKDAEDVCAALFIVTLSQGSKCDNKMISLLPVCCQFVTECFQAGKYQFFYNQMV